MYPTLQELLILVVVIAELIGAGYLIKRRWTSRNETVPLSVTIAMWLGMFVIYFSITAMLYNSRLKEIEDQHDRITAETVGANPDVANARARNNELFLSQDPRIGVMVPLGWAFLLWTIPAWYFTRTIVFSLAARNIERIDPFSAKIEDPSEFAAARKLALRGDIDAAVSMYRTYKDNEVNALFEAARLLRSEDRYAEAADIFSEICNRFSGKNRVWADACYQLAKLYEGPLASPVQAKATLRELLNRAPETRFAHLAGADLARLQILEGAKEEDPVDAALADPFYRPSESRARIAAPAESKPANTASPLDDDDEAPIPPADPFMAIRERAKATAVGTDGQSAPRKKLATKSINSRRELNTSPGTKSVAKKKSSPGLPKKKSQ